MGRNEHVVSGGVIPLAVITAPESVAVGSVLLLAVAEGIDTVFVAYVAGCVAVEEPRTEHPWVGVWGQRRLKHIIKHCKPFYNKMLGEHTLYDYLLQIDRDAEEMFSELVKRMAIQEGVSEQLKADNQIELVGKMNNFRQRATEIINHDIIYN